MNVLLADPLTDPPSRGPHEASARPYAASTGYSYAEAKKQHKEDEGSLHVFQAILVDWPYLQG